MKLQFQKSGTSCKLRKIIFWHYHHSFRSLTPSMLTWVAKTGRFIFHKDTSLVVEVMMDKLRAVKSVPNTPLKWVLTMLLLACLSLSVVRFYTAKIQFLKTLLDNGGKFVNNHVVLSIVFMWCHFVAGLVEWLQTLCHGQWCGYAIHKKHLKRKDLKSSKCCH